MFSGKNKKNIKLSSGEIAKKVVNVKDQMYTCMLIEENGKQSKHTISTSSELKFQL